MTNEPVTDERIEELEKKYRGLFERQPGFWTTTPGLLRGEDREPVEGTRGLLIIVEEILDQSTLPKAERIPECLEGVPVQIIDHSYAEALSAENE